MKALLSRGWAWFAPRAKQTEPRPKGSIRRESEDPPRARDAAALFSGAEKFAKRLEVNPAALDYLYKHSRAGLPRAEWERSARIACAMYRVVRRSRRLLPWRELMDLNKLDRLFDGLKSTPESPKGTLLITFHGAFAPVAVELYRQRCAGAATLAAGGILEEGSETMADFKDAMFKALNRLRDGGVVLMSPDGMRGRQEARVAVFDVADSIGGGAAFLAFTSGCNTAWYTAVRDGDGFAPMFEFGPSRRDGEKLKEFSDRFHEFYAKQIETIFTGDPRNMVVFGRWAKLFAAKQKQQQNP